MSRPEDRDIRDRLREGLPDCSELILQVREDDLRKVIAYDVLSLPSGFIGLKDRTKELLMENVGDNFLWIRMIWQELKSLEVPSEEELESMIRHHPKGLTDMYVRMLDVLFQKPLVQRILLWVVYARRPLRLKELEKALSIDLSDFGKSEEVVQPRRRNLTADVLRV